eukprot:2389484-Rhodomonas_salina.1
MGSVWMMMVIGGLQDHQQHHHHHHHHHNDNNNNNNNTPGSDIESMCAQAAPRGWRQHRGELPRAASPTPCAAPTMQMLLSDREEGWDHGPHARCSDRARRYHTLRSLTLRLLHAQSGTAVGSGTARHGAAAGAGRGGPRRQGSGLRARYAMSGTEIAYGAARTLWKGARR